MEKFSNKYLPNLPSFLYGLAIVVVTLIPYVPNNYIVIVLSIIGLIGLYTLLISVGEKAKKRLCLLAYVLSFLLLIFAFKNTINGTPFYIWLLTGYTFDPTFLIYIAELYFICILFTGASVFYFTHFYFRGYIMIFIMLIPIALYYKMIENVPVIYIVFLVLSLTLMYIIEKQKLRLNDNHIEITAALTRFFGLISIFVAIVCILVPKSGMAQYRYIFDEVVAMNPFTNRNINSIGYVTDKSSSSAYGYLNQNRLLYTVNAYEPLYLRRTAFGRYDGEYWVAEDKTNDSDWSSNNEAMNMRTFYENMSWLYEEYREVFDKFKISKEDIPNVTEEKLNAIITPKQFYANYFLNTVRTFDISTDSSDAMYYKIGMNNYGCLQFINWSGGSIGNSSYEIDYYSDIARKNEKILNFAKKFNDSEYYEFIIELEAKCENESISKWLNLIEMDLFEITMDVWKNSKNSDSIKKLALEITKNADTDYEKAVALEKYFSQNGYEYSLSYEPEDSSIEYFIFNSKTGACGQYATAMTLMANAIGLKARYTEGFVMTNTYNDGSYYVTAGNSHAYVEVYIPGYGYTVFEPTVASTENTLSGNLSTAINRFSDIVAISKITISYLIVVAAALLIFLWILNVLFLNKIKDIVTVFRCSISKDKTLAVYAVFLKKLQEKSAIETKNMTPNELCLLAKKQYDIDISKLTSILVMRIYGNMEISIDDDFIKNMPALLSIIRIKNKSYEKEKRKTRKRKNKTKL